MTKEKHRLLLAVAAVSLAAALAACDQAAPAAGGPAATPAPSPEPASPAAEPPGLRTETLIVAIVADDATPAASLADRVANVEQHGQTINREVKFPADFTYESQTDLHVYTHAVPWAAITQDVLERGGIIPWASFDGGATWITSSFSFPFWNLQIAAEVGEVHFVINGTVHLGADRPIMERLIRGVTRDHPLLIRLYVIKTTGTQPDD